MSKETRSSHTVNRIIEASLELFNSQGERAVSTNHIAAHLHMSPGNLYYHFANKDEIIVQLFKRYSSEMFDYLANKPLPESVSQTTAYMRGVYDVMWKYRFLYSDVNTLLNRSADLLGKHNEFTRERIAPLLVKLLAQLRDKGVLTGIDETGLNDLSINMWLITKYWFDFDTSLRGPDRQAEPAKQRGVYRTLSLLRPYLDTAHLPEFDAAMQGLNLS